MNRRNALKSLLPVLVDATGALYVGDGEAHRIRVVR